MRRGARSWRKPPLSSSSRPGNAGIVPQTDCRGAGYETPTSVDIIAILDATDDKVSPQNFKAGQEVCMELVERLERQRKVIDDALSELSHVYALLTARLMADPNPDEKQG